MSDLAQTRVWRRAVLLAGYEQVGAWMEGGQTVFTVTVADQAGHSVEAVLAITVAAE